MYGNAERAIVELTHRMANGDSIREITDLRGSAFLRKKIPAGWREIDSTQIDQPGVIKEHKNPYQAPHPSNCDDAKKIRMQQDTSVEQRLKRTLCRQYLLCRIRRP